MCTGVEIALIVAGGIAAGSKVAEGQAKAEAERAQAAIDMEDARLAGIQADDAIRRSLVTEGRIREGGARLLGTQKLAFSSGNIDPTSGSAASVQAGAAGVTEEQAHEARLNGTREAYGYRTQGLRFQARASARYSAASSYAGAGIVGAVVQGVKTGAQAGEWWQSPADASSQPSYADYASISD